MLRTHVPDATPVSEEARESQGNEAAMAPSMPWQTLQASLGNAAVGRLLGTSPPAGYVMRQPEGQALLSDDAPTADSTQAAPGLDDNGAEELKGGNTKRTKEQAIAMVDKHVEPKDCFVWYENN